MNYLLLLLICIQLQNSFGQNFPRKEISLLFNKELVLKEKPIGEQDSYFDFYSDEDFFYKYGGILNNNYKILAGKVFKLISYEPNKNKNLFKGERYFKLKIYNDSIGTLFFDYDSESQASFPFEVIGSIDLPADFYCKEIQKTEDKFTNEITYRSPESEGISFIKVEKNNARKIYLLIKVWKLQLTMQNKGLILLLENKKRVDKPNAFVDVETEYFDFLESSIPLYSYSTLIELTRSDINLLKKYNITDKRIYIHDTPVKYGETLREFLKCIIN